MSKSEKVVLIGLDGATFRVLRPLVEAGIMPTLGRFMREGAWGILRTTKPPVTCPAWPTMFTGVNPGQHGVFSFSHRDGDTGRMRTASSRDIRVPKVWDILGKAHRQSAILNVPITFPADPIEGVMLTGFVSPDDSPSVTYPEALAQELRQDLGDLEMNWSVLGYRPSDCAKREAHVRRINELMALRLRQFDQIIKRQPFDFCFLVHEYPDRVYHLYHQILDPEYPPHRSLENRVLLELLHEGHRIVDQSIAKMVEHYGPGANYLIVSDHGFDGVRKWVYVNNLLQARGLTRFHDLKVWGDVVARRLNLSPKMRQRLGLLPLEAWHRQDPSRAPLIDYERSVAFAGPQLEQAVYVNLKGRYEAGIVDPGDYLRVRAKIIDVLKGTRDPETGQSVFEGVWSRDELYEGPCLENAPDVVYDLARGYITSNSTIPSAMLRGRCTRPLKRGWDISGYHRPEGVFIGYGPAFGTVSGFEASILDIAPTVLYLMNVPIPDYMEGNVIRPAIQPGQGNGRAARVRFARPHTWPCEPAPYTEAEQLAVTQRLEELGYL